MYNSDRNRIEQLPPHKQESDRSRHGMSAQPPRSEDIYLQAVDATSVPIEQSRSVSSKKRNDIIEAQQKRHEQLQQGQHAESQRGRLVDEQKALQQQMRLVDNIQHGRPSSRKSRETNETNVSQYTNHYDTPENENIATNIDPTYNMYSSIGPPRERNSRHEYSDEAIPQSVPVIQNVKRSSHDESSKKKKKWFSKKEKNK